MTNNNIYDQRFCFNCQKPEHMARECQQQRRTLFTPRLNKSGNDQLPPYWRNNRNLEDIEEQEEQQQYHGGQAKLQVDGRQLGSCSIGKKISTCWLQIK
jgi:hypothetical protein